MKYAAPGAAGLGVSLEEVAAMAGKLGDAGMQGSMGGTALRAIMLRLASPPKKAGDALKSLGVQVSDAEGNMRSMPDILTEVYEKTKDLGNLERTEILSSIAGVEASNAMSELVSRAGSGELQALISQLQGSQGELESLSATMSDNTMGDFKEMTSGIDAFRTSIFEANGGGLRSFIQSITAMVGRMTEFANAHPQLMSVLGKLFATLAIGAVVIGGIGAVMLTILGPMALLRASLITMGLPTTLTPLAMLGKAFGMVGGAVRALTMTLMANPILALVLALSVLAFTVYQNWDTLGPMFAALWERIKAIFNMGIQALKSFIMNFTPVGLFIQAFAAVWPYLASLGATFKQYGANLLEGLKNGILGKAQSVVDGIKNVAGRVKGAFTGLLGIRSPSRVFDSYGGFMMQGLSGGVMTNANRAINAVKNVAGRVRNAGADAISDYAPMSIDSRKSILPPRGQSSMAMSGGMSAGNITININGATDPQAVAREVQRVLATEQRNQMARQRSRLSDID